MTTLNDILNIGASGLYAAQTGLGVTSDNIANLNTTGFVREVVNQNSSTTTTGVGSGVTVTGITRAANQYLQNTSLAASAAASSATAISNLLGQAQSLFGDPSSSTSYLNQLNQVFSDLAATANNPATSINSVQTVSDVGQFLSQSQSISTQLDQLSSQADSRIGADVAQANQLLSQISSLNGQITTATATGANASDPQNTQSALITQLSSLMDVQVSTTALGGVVLRSDSGATLVGPSGAATLGYQASTSANSQVTITPPGNGTEPVPLTVGSGEISGLLNLRNTLLPGVANQLSQYVSGAVTAINQASNAASSAPPPATLTGANVGTDLATAISGFTGATNIAVVSTSNEQLQQQVTIDFDAGTMTVAGGATSSFTPSTFLSTLNTALGGSATASFTNGALSISAASGSGVAIADDPTDPSSKVGQGFSQYFGLNNLITSNTITNYNTGLQPSSTNGFTGGTITLQVDNASGAPLTNATVAIPSGGTMQDVLDALNSSSTGVGLYGQYSLNGSGALTFTPTTPGATIAVTDDQTQWGAGGASITELFGLGTAQQANRTGSYQVRADIAANPTNLQTATLNLGAAAGDPVLAIGDGSGALAMSKAGATQIGFGAAGSLAAMTTSVTQYGAELGGALGDQAAAASQASTSATAVQTEANTQLQSVEGVNLDQELVNLTTYQQAYSAASRLIAANQTMFSALISMVSG